MRKKQWHQYFVSGHERPVMANITGNQVKGKKWLEGFARFGIVSKGVVYCLIGILAAMTAFGLAEKRADRAASLQLIYEQPLGKLLLALIAAGLFGYVTWRFFQAFQDIDGKGNDTKGKFIRAGYAASALVYLSIAVYAAKMALNGNGGDDGGSREFIISKILSYPKGEYIVGIIALVIIGNGCRQIFRAVTGKFMKNVELNYSTRSGLFRKTGTAGYTSRGIVLIIIGYFFFRAALQSDASEADGGTNAAFQFLENTFGSLLMGVVAIGLLGYGLFMFVKGKYQKIDLNF